MLHTTSRLVRAGLLTGGLIVAAARPVTATTPSVPAPEPEPLALAVVAQEVVTLPGGEHAWNVSTDELGEPTPGGGDTLTFVAAADGTFTVAAPAGGDRYVLATGEAAVLTSSFELAPVPADAKASVVTISLGGADDDGGFTVPAGDYDAELVRVDLDPGETAELPDPGPVPMLLFAPEGGMIVTSDAETMDAELTLGAHQTFDGSLSVINAGIADATVLAVRITPVVGAAADAPPPASSSTAP